MILAHLPDAENRHLSDQADLESSWGEEHSRIAIEDRIRQTRLSGYAVNPGLVVEGSGGLAAAVFDELGRPQWALSLPGVQTRLGGERSTQLGERLTREAHALTRRMARR